MDDTDPPYRRQLTELLGEPTRYLDAGDAGIRRLAVAACRGSDPLPSRIAEMLATDPTPMVRRECAEVLGLAGLADPNPLVVALEDAAPEVREAAANALGEIASAAAVSPLLARADDGAEDKLVREAAVAALGAIGDRRAVPTLLGLIAEGPPQVRRRCVAALSVFEGAEVEQALVGAASDRNPMVREAAEMVVGRAAE
jgi:HEAT repeat protein